MSFVLAALLLLAPPASASPPPAPQAAPPEAPDYGADDLPDRAEPGPDDPFYPPKNEAARLAAATVVRPGVAFAPGRGLKLSSPGGRFSLALGLRTGFIYSARRDDAGFAHTLDVRRLRLLLIGNVLGPHIKYYVQLALAPRELDVHDGVVHSTPVLDTYLRFDRLRDATFTVGQYRVPFSRERNVSDVNPLLVDRSLANAEFNLDRDVGLAVHSDDLAGLGRLRYYAGVFMGEGRDAGRSSDPGLLYVARLDFLPFGRFDDYESSDLPRLRRFRASFGGAYAFHDRARKDRGTLGDEFADGGTMTAHNVTADAAFRWRGWSLDAAYHWRRGWRTPGDLAMSAPPVAPRNGQGWMAQTAFLVPRTRLEPAVRVSGARGLGDTSMQDRDELGGGLNYYFFGHNLKLQLDWFHTWTRGPATPTTTGSDLVRLQLQVNL